MMPPRLKAAANYQNERLRKMQARLDSYDNCLFPNTQAKVTEALGVCFYLIREKGADHGILFVGHVVSITRETLIKLVTNGLDIEVRRRDIDRSELQIADQAFPSGSMEEATSVLSVDRHKVGEGLPGDLTPKLQHHYLNKIWGVLNGYLCWLTPVFE